MNESESMVLHSIIFMIYDLAPNVIRINGEVIGMEIETIKLSEYLRYLRSISIVLLCYFFWILHVWGRYIVLPHEVL